MEDKAKALVSQDTPEKILAWYCSKCGAVASSKDNALQCCEPYHCKHCGSETPRYHLICDNCSRAELRRRELARFEKAPKILSADYGDAPVFHDDEFVMGGVESVLEDCEGDGKPLPTHVWATSPTYFQLDINEILEDALDRFQEDAEDHYFTVGDLNGVEELREAVDAFNKKQLGTDESCGVRLFFEDGRAVILESLEAE